MFFTYFECVCIAISTLTHSGICYFFQLLRKVTAPQLRKCFQVRKEHTFKCTCDIDKSLCHLLFLCNKSWISCIRKVQTCTVKGFLCLQSKPFFIFATRDCVCVLVQQKNIPFHREILSLVLLNLKLLFYV